MKATVRLAKRTDPTAWLVLSLSARITRTGTAS